jgi:hypothetical protein
MPIHDDRARCAAQNLTLGEPMDRRVIPVQSGRFGLGNQHALFEWAIVGHRTTDARIVFAALTTLAVGLVPAMMRLPSRCRQCHFIFQREAEHIAGPDPKRRRLVAVLVYETVPHVAV